MKEGRSQMAFSRRYEAFLKCSRTGNNPISSTNIIRVVNASPVDQFVKEVGKNNMTPLRKLECMSQNESMSNTRFNIYVEP
mmetsp:Transcript_39966/g.45857  ORF Transcript_39966/g.45857 Transcript_39966/m.45857 type:complete len:81 (-) Transcript_39966:971-1213(-)